VLCRRRKNNPIFVGDPGVGKTAVVEGLALHVHQKKVPKALDGVAIYALDMGALLAGTKFRGEFEQRMKGVLKALRKIPDAILFIDEIHTVIGAGAATGGAMDASTLLKPSLANGELRCIGSTTYHDYKSYFERDHALSRRFQRIDVVEPTVEEAVRILQGLRPHYEAHHGVTYSPAAIRSAVELSARHINDRHLPDKAIDVIDEAGAAMRLRAPDRAKRPEVPHRADPDGGKSAPGRGPRGGGWGQDIEAASPDRAGPCGTCRSPTEASRRSRAICGRSSSARTRPSTPWPRPSSSRARAWARRRGPSGPSSSRARRASGRPSWPSSSPGSSASPSTATT
jgi:hypothetical protein